MKYIDLFGGIGGFSLGIKQATKGEWECVYYNDFDKYAVQTYNKNFGTEYEPTDITTVKEADIPDHDVICAGFPCQTFSIAGKRRGFQDTRGTLFFDIMRIAKFKGTSYLFLENVKGLLNHEKGKTFTKILQTLQELGYEYQWMVLNSKFFGVAQNRERVFIIANLRGTPRPEILPFRENAEKISRLSGNQEQVLTLERKEFREHKSEGTPTLKNRMGTGGNNVPMISNASRREVGFKKIAGALQARDYKDPKIVMNLQKRSADRPSLTKICPCGSKKLYQNCCGVPAGSGTIGKVDEAYCLDSNNSQGVGSLTNKLRRLTPKECERLQGYPDDWTKGVSDTQRYKQLGNAVTVNVIEAIMENWK